MCSRRRGILLLTWVFLAAAGGVPSWQTWTVQSSQILTENPQARHLTLLAAEDSHATNLEFLERAKSAAHDMILSNGVLSASTPAVLAADTTDPPPSSGARAPSLLEMLEGREPDMAIWLAIAVAFFLLGWIVGAIHAKRRERSRRSKLRF